MCKGTERFRITQRNHLVHGLWIASVSQLDRDLSIPIPEDLKKTATALTQVLHTLHARDALNPAAALPTPEQLDDCGWVANRWCELLPVPMELKAAADGTGQPAGTAGAGGRCAGAHGNCTVTARRATALPAAPVP